MNVALKIVLLLGLLWSSDFLNAQKYGNVWQLGNNLGLDFNNCDPVVTKGGNNDGFEGTSSISDENGQLLFYTNSDAVWNRVHSVMPNGLINSTGGTLSQVLIIPQPQSNNLF